MLGRGRVLVCLGWGQGGISNLTSIPTAYLHPAAKEIQLMHRAPVVGILGLNIAEINGTQYRVQKNPQTTQLMFMIN